MVKRAFLLVLMLFILFAIVSCSQKSEDIVIQEPTPIVQPVVKEIVDEPIEQPEEIINLKQTCIDTDGGDYSFEAGTTSIGEQKLYDTCQESFLYKNEYEVLEYSCEQTQGFSSTTIEGIYQKQERCVYGCDNGACNENLKEVVKTVTIAFYPKFSDLELVESQSLILDNKEFRLIKIHPNALPPTYTGAEFEVNAKNIGVIDIGKQLELEDGTIIRVNRINDLKTNNAIVDFTVYLRIEDEISVGQSKIFFQNWNVYLDSIPYPPTLNEARFIVNNQNERVVVSEKDILSDGSILELIEIQ